MKNKRAAAFLLYLTVLAAITVATRQPVAVGLSGGVGLAAGYIFAKKNIL